MTWQPLSDKKCIQTRVLVINDIAKACCCLFNLLTFLSLFNECSPLW